MAQEALKPADDKATDFMDAEQVATYLGIDRGTILDLIGQGKMPAIDFGGQWRFCRMGLMAWGVEAGFANLTQRI